MKWIKRVLAVFFVISWVVGEVPRLWWQEVLPVRPMDMAAGLIFLAEIVKNKSNKYYKSYKNTGLLLIVALAGSWILGLRIWSLEESLPGLLYLARTLVYGWLIWRGGEIFGGVRKWIGPAMAAFVGLGLLQYIFLPDTRFLLKYGWDEHYWRLVGTVLDPNYFGVMAGMIGFWAIKNYKGYKGYMLGIAAAAFAALILTWSRASWVAFGAAAGWWILSERSRILGKLRVLGILGILGVGVWWAAPKPGGEGVNLWRTASIDQRIESWNQAVGVWKQHPWLGVGFNNYGVGSRAPSSSWLLILSTLGVAGMGIGGIGGIRLVGEIMKTEDRRFWLGIIILISVHAIFNNTLFYPPVLGLVAMMGVEIDK